MTDSIPISKSVRKWVETSTHRSMRDQARYIKSLGFSMPQFFMLMHLHYKKHCSISQLSEHMDITAAASSQLVDKFVQGGLLERAEDPSDRRTKQVTLSAKGHKLIENVIRERFRWVDDLIASLSAADQKKVGEALDILVSAAEEMDAATEK